MNNDTLRTQQCSSGVRYGRKKEKEVFPVMLLTNIHMPPIKNSSLPVISTVSY